jgi:hypothetical protein
MKVTAEKTTIIVHAAGTNLRSYLGAAISFCLLSAFVGVPARAQIVVLKPLHIRHVQGYVTDEKSNAVAGVEVDLLRDGKPVIKTRADETGWFQIEGASGRYYLSVSAGSSELGREVAVGTNLFTLFCHKTLYVMVRPNQFCNDCSIRVYTNKRQFFKSVWWNTGHYY